MNRGYFVTGTDTEIGKTLCASAIIASLRGRGYRVAPMKPVASGCGSVAGRLRSADALALAKAADSTHPYEWVNPYAFAPPIAPHIAAAAVGVEIDLDHIVGCWRRLLQHCDMSVVEGVGGWCVPLSARSLLMDLVRRMDLPVVLVVGMRLGCINHALLSAERIERDGAHLVGWIANACEPDMAQAESNLATLRSLIRAPLLGSVPHDPQLSARSRARYLDLPKTV